MPEVHNLVEVTTKKNSLKLPVPGLLDEKTALTISRNESDLRYML